MKLKKPDCQVIPDRPFETDLLGRQDEIERLTPLLLNMDPPFVLSINSPWGTGKSTFVDMWAASLRTSGNATVLKFNAWESDFAEDPLVAFLGEMDSGLKEEVGKTGPRAEAWEKAKKVGTTLARRSIPAIARVLTAGLFAPDNADIQQLLSEFAGNATEGVLGEYLQTKSDIERFKNSLSQVIGSEDTPAKPVIVFVDELDRCRPLYAIGLLERIKHIFDIPGLIFVLSMDRRALSHSIRAVYGSGLDSEGYLRRFVDLEYRLATPRLDGYLRESIRSMGFEKFFRPDEYEHFSQTFIVLAQGLGLSLREVNQILTRVNVVIRSTPEGHHTYPVLLSFLVTTHEKERHTYDEFAHGSGTLEVALKWLVSVLPVDSRYTFGAALLEGFMIAAKGGWTALDGQRKAEYDGYLRNADSDPRKSSYLRQVAQIASNPLNDKGLEIDLTGLVERIEMLERFRFREDA